MAKLRHIPMDENNTRTLPVKISEPAKNHWREKLLKNNNNQLIIQEKDIMIKVFDFYKS